MRKLKNTYLYKYTFTFFVQVKVVKKYLNTSGLNAEVDSVQMFSSLIHVQIQEENQFKNLISDNFYGKKPPRSFLFLFSNWPFSYPQFKKANVGGYEQEKLWQG